MLLIASLNCSKYELITKQGSTSILFLCLYFAVVTINLNCYFIELYKKIKCN